MIGLDSPLVFLHTQIQKQPTAHSAAELCPESVSGFAATEGIGTSLQAAREQQGLFVFWHFALHQSAVGQTLGVTKESWLGGGVTTWIAEMIGRICASANPHGDASQLIALGSDLFQNPYGRLVSAGRSLGLKLSLNLIVID